MTDFPTGMPVIARGKWFRGMTLIPGYGAVGCNPKEHPAPDVPIRPDLAHRPGLPGRRRESSRAPDRATPGGSTADPPDVQRAGRSWRHGAARRWTDATAATVRNGSRSAGRQPGPVTFVPRSETSNGRLPPDLGAGERIRTADLPFTRSAAPSIEGASCTDDTDHHTDGTRCAGIIRRAGPRTGPRPRALRPAILLLCVTPWSRRPQ